MASYLVILITDSHQTCVKMCPRDMHTAPENDRCRRSFVLEKFNKNLTGAGMYSAANDPETANDPRPEMTPKLDRK